MSRETLEARVARMETLGDALLRDIQRLQDQHKDDIARVDRDVETFGPLAGQLIEFVGEVKSLGTDLADLKTELREDRQQRVGMSTSLKLALVSGTFLLLCALVAAVAQILSS